MPSAIPERSLARSGYELALRILRQGDRASPQPSHEGRGSSGLNARAPDNG